MNWAALQSRLNTAALSVFGETVRIAGVDVQADFHSPDEAIDAGDGVAVARVPRVVALSSDVQSSPVGQLVMARSMNYVIADARHDGRGMAILELEAAVVGTGRQLTLGGMQITLGGLPIALNP